MRKGFTLVELSIVLVIIGLLIGGILVAQSMISTARVTAQVAQIQQFDAAVENFKTKFNYLPGDAPGFGGDGDGLITMGASEGWRLYINSYAGEIANFWNNLFLDQYSNSPTPTAGSIPITTGASKNVPLAKLGVAGSFLMASAIGLNDGSAYADQSNPRNYYAIIPPSSIPTAITHCCYQLIPIASGKAALTPVEQAALDTKMDDGKADTGNLISGNITACGDGSGEISAFPLSTCSVGAVYQVQNATHECTPFFRIGGQADDPQ